MQISYSNNAKNDLVKTAWRARDTILKTLEDLCKKGNLNEHIKDVHNHPELKKIIIAGFVVLGKISADTFDIISVVEKKQIILPE